MENETVSSEQITIPAINEIPDSPFMEFVSNSGNYISIRKDKIVAVEDLKGIKTKKGNLCGIYTTDNFFEVKEKYAKIMEML